MRRLTSFQFQFEIIIDRQKYINDPFEPQTTANSNITNDTTSKTKKTTKQQQNNILKCNNDTDFHQINVKSN